ncbi:MAG: hypothetical protein ACI4SD_03400 [Suilimivivens sp.]
MAGAIPFLLLCATFAYRKQHKPEAAQTGCSTYRKPPPTGGSRFTKKECCGKIFDMDIET